MNTKFLRISGATVASAALIFGLAACSSSGSDSATSATTGTSASASSSGPAEPVASIPSLSGESTSVALSTGFTDALTSLGLTPGVLGTAKLENGSLIFPITGGNVDYYTPGTRDPYVVGDIQHDGSGITLTAGDTVVSLENFDIDPGGSKLYAKVSAGTVAAPGTTVVGDHVYLFNLDGSTLQPLQADESAGTATLTGTRVLISPDAAALLNQTFNTTAVTDTLEVGIATIVVNTK